MKSSNYFSHEPRIYGWEQPRKRFHPFVGIGMFLGFFHFIYVLGIVFRLPPEQIKIGATISIFTISFLYVVYMKKIFISIMRPLDSLFLGFVLPHFFYYYVWPLGLMLRGISTPLLPFSLIMPFFFIGTFVNIALFQYNISVREKNMKENNLLYYGIFILNTLISFSFW
jgi:hypothetical protein